MTITQSELDHTCHPEGHYKTKMCMKSKWVAEKVFDHIRRDLKSVSTVGLQNTLTTLVNKEYPYHTSLESKGVMFTADLWG